MNESSIVWNVKKCTAYVKIKDAFASFSYDTSATTTASSRKGGRKKNSMKWKE